MWRGPSRGRCQPPGRRATLAANAGRSHQRPAAAASWRPGIGHWRRQSAMVYAGTVVLGERCVSASAVRCSRAMQAGWRTPSTELTLTLAATRFLMACMLPSRAAVKRSPILQPATTTVRSARESESECECCERERANEQMKEQQTTVRPTFQAPSFYESHADGIPS